ncbi:flavin-containing monooxygenase [Nocardioides donggukensis]|uniref:NAD(P)/FAD-dependent oxidoreductase n=1 Tax=Nocardioides donggukensis TaxID=2774019 RepID=A0A927Q430_9ACTN|nr:NAD(P)/FAD-dependent oxidoreductase [Nocardioides donggukensis]MBD8871126.1 NAD(P)/FAD-dependent oxidoreductase [Nocardioides donggukensis]
MTEHVDVLIVGAGLSGIGAACQLRREHPGRSVAILESRAASGGTWDLFRYPGVRSDSDMFTLGYRFKPWLGEKALADGPSILAYVREAAREHGVDREIRYGHTVVGAAWDSGAARWTVTAETGDGPRTLTCGFLWSCSGYYDYDEGYTPQLPGIDDFAGTVVHPQHWPEDLDHAGRRIVVIGSGATAVTLVPALADQAEHVTMLQRSPTYIVSLPSRDGFALRARRLLPEPAAYRVTRWKNVLMATGIYQLCQRFPGAARRAIRSMTERQLPGVDVGTHFRPRYDPWDQRLCLVPDGDLFRSLREGSSSIVTDTIETFTETGVRVSSGAELAADLVITATGLNLKPFGGVELLVDGEPVRLPEAMAYKGLMLSGVPNFAYTIGYTNASWTLKADLVAEYVCRLLAHLDETGQTTVVPVRDPDVTPQPFLDFTAGYVLRKLDELPQQGDRAPWRLRQNYLRDVGPIRRGAIEDGTLAFSRAG